MAHGDDQGLRLPPKLAPIQAVVVPIWRKEKEREAVMSFAHEVLPVLKAAGIRIHFDQRDNLTPFC